MAGGWRRSEADGFVVQECGAGLVPVRTEGQRFAFAAPPLTRYGAVDEARLARIALALGIARDRTVDSSWIVNGPEWVGVRLSSAEEVLSLRPDPAKLGDLVIGVIGPHPPGHETQLEVRAFLGGDPMWEDPVTGSLNAGLARWLVDSGVTSARYTAAQGKVIGYEGRVHVAVEGNEIWVGGDVTACVRGVVNL